MDKFLKILSSKEFLLTVAGIVVLASTPAGRSILSKVSNNSIVEEKNNQLSSLESDRRKEGESLPKVYPMTAANKVPVVLWSILFLQAIMIIAIIAVLYIKL